MHRFLYSLGCLLISSWLLLFTPLTQAKSHEVPHSATLMAIADQLEARLNNKRYLLEAITELVRSNPDISAAEFESAAREMYSGNSELLSIQLARDQVVSHVYPLTGNEQALGHDLLADPERQQQTRNAITNQSVTLAGPYSLVQGGTGIILRQPIYLDNAQTECWGLAIVVLNWQQLARQVGLLSEQNPVQLAIRNISESSSAMELGDRHLFDDTLSYQRELSLANARWEIALKSPLTEQDREYHRLLIASLVIAGVLLTMVAISCRRRNDWRSPASLTIALLLFCLAGLVSYNDAQKRNSMLMAGLAADQIRAQIYQRLNDNQNYLHLLSQEYLQGQLPAEEFLSRGAQYVSDHPELLNLNRISAQLQITNVTPRKGNVQILGLTITLAAPLEAALLARETRSPAHTRIFTNIQGKYSFETWYPIYRGNQFEGLIAAVYDIEKLLEQIVPATIASRYRVTVEPAESDHLPENVLTRALAQPGYNATLRLELLQSSGPLASYLLFAAAVLFAMGLFVGIRTLQKNNHTLNRRYKQLSEAQEALYREKEHSQTTLAAINEGVIILDRYGDICQINSAAQTLLSCTESAAVGIQLPALPSLQEAQDELHNLIRHTLASRPQGQLELVLHGAGEACYLHCSANAIEVDGVVEGAVIALHDVSRLKHISQELEFRACHDSLTGLINRSEFERRCKQALEDGGYHLLYMDLDQFKLVNDTCGHLAGDQLLVDLSALLQKQLLPGDTLARLGGDEFGLLFLDQQGQSVHARADQLRTTVKEFRFVWQDKIFELGCSIGMVALHDYQGEYDSALARADMACYIAKDSGRNRIHLFTESDQQVSQREGEMSWIGQLQSAMEQGRFELYQQAILPIAARSSTKLQFEVLLRLRDEQDNIIPPGAFLPAAERYQLISALDQHVIELALSHFEQHEEILRALGSVSINLSGQSISDPAFVNAVIERLQRSPVPCHTICFEITETAAIANLTRASEFIQQLRAMGVRFALDDFGSGMASFGYLKELPVDYLKIDGSFVRDITSDPRDRAFVEAIHNIGKTMNMSTVAEFIEDDATLALLTEIGIDYGQGYGLARPAPLSELKVVEPA